MKKAKVVSRREERSRSLQLRQLIGIKVLQDIFSWNEEDAKLMAEMKHDSFPAEERARRRSVNKRARTARKVTRKYG